MKFTIEMEDFWLEEGEIAEELKRHVQHEVVRGILDSIKDKVEQQITKKVDEVIEQKITLVIDSELANLVDTGVIIRNKHEIPLVDHLKNVFQTSHGWNNPDAKMKAIAEKFGNEIKLQYNNIFANKIVQNMKEQGLLKDEVVQILLEGK